MKINPEKTKDRLKNVTPANRVFIYDASIIMEFVRATFVPTSHFLVNEGAMKGKMELDEKDFKSDVVRENRFSIGDIYNWYVMFRNNMPYTRPIENKYRFGMIISKMRYHKNGFEFLKMRVGSAQLNYFGPIMLRAKAPQEVRDANPIPKPTVETIEVSLEEVMEEGDMQVHENMEIAVAPEQVSDVEDLTQVDDLSDY